MASYSLEQRRRDEEERKESAPEAEPEPAESQSLADRTLELQSSHGNAAVARMVAGSPEAKAMLQREAATADAPGNTSGQDFEQRMLLEDIAQIVEYLRMQILDAPWEQRIVDIIRNWRENDRLHGATGTPMLDHGLLLLKTKVFTRRTARTLWIETYVNAYDTLWAELEDDRLDQFKAVIEGSKHATAGPESQNENYAKDLAKQEGMGFFAAAMAMGKGLAGVGDLIVRTGSGLVGHEINPKWAKAVEESGKEAGYDLFGTAYLSPDELTKRGFSQEEAERLSGEKLLFGMNASDIGTVGGTFIWKLVEMAKGPIKEIKTALKLPGLLLKIEDGFREIGERFEELEKAHKEVDVGTAIRDAKIRNAGFEIAGAAVELGIELMGDSSAGKEAADTVSKAVLTGAQQAKRIKFILETGDKLARIVGIVTDPEKKPEDKDKELFELFMDVFTDAFKEFNEGFEKGLGEE
jgi:hypothetical protein